MPSPVGLDRVATEPGGRLVLSTPASKGWRARRAGSLLAPEHPGTAIRWEEEVWEVVGVEELPAGGSRYVLAPWDERHAIRVCETYDEVNERKRRDERRQQGLRERKGKGALLLSPIVGLLPGGVQERLECEWGVSGTLLTGISIVLPLAVGAASVVLSLVAGFVPLGRLGLSWLPPGTFLLGNYLFVESVLRLTVLWAQARPIGSLLGIPLQAAGRFLGLLPGAAREGRGGSTPAPDRARADQDRLAMLEPLLAFLPERDQRTLAARFGFDPLRWGRRSARLLLGFAALALPGRLLTEAGRAGSGLLVSLLLLYLAGEQAWRLRLLASGLPAPGALGLLVAPFARPLLRGDPANAPPVDSAG